jgi:hypothetical protein
MFHPRLDLGRRVQHWAWYWQIRNCAGLSETRLELVFAGSSKARGRKRSFYRVRTLGSCPTDERGFMNRTSIFKAIHASPVADQFQFAKDTFESLVWEVVCTRELTAARRDEITAVLMRKIGLVRTPARHADGLRLLVKDEQLLREVGVGLPAQENLDLLAETGHADVLALLCTLYLERISVRDLPAAMRLAEAVELCAQTFEASLQWPIEHYGLLVRLVSDRILRDRWLTERDYREQLGTQAPTRASRSEAGRRKEVRAFVEWYLTPGRGAPDAERDGFPRPSNPAWQWLVDNEARLLDWISQLHRHVRERRFGFVFQQGRPMVEREEARIVQLCTEVATQLRELATAAGDDWQQQLPSLFPKLDRIQHEVELGNRAAAFERFVADRLADPLPGSEGRMRAK